MTTTEATVGSTEATVAADLKLNEDAATKDKASTKATWTASVNAHKAAVSAHTEAVAAHATAVKKTAFLLKWNTWSVDYTKNDWANNSTDQRFERWMVTAMKESATKVDAQVFQTKNTNDLADAKKANDDASSDAAKAKVEELEKWVTEGDKILTNAWNKGGYAQDW